MKSIHIALALIIVLAAGAFFLLNDKESSIQFKSAKAATGIPENYYSPQKPADFDSPVELIRFAESIRPYTSGFSIRERVAFFEWYLKNRGFNVSFAHSRTFRNADKDHVWLIVTNKLGEKMAVEPSSLEMDAESISPTTNDYKSYQRRFKDIYELSKNTGGFDQYSWWREKTGQNLFDESIMLLKKKEMAGGT